MSAKKEMGRAANGTGSLRKRVRNVRGKETVYWEGRVTVGFDPRSGKQVQKTVTGKTQRDVTMRMQEIANEVNQGTYTEPSKMTVADWLDIWTSDYLNDVKKSTAEQYIWTVQKYIIPALGAKKLFALTAPMIQALYNDLSRREKPLSAKTIKNVHGVLHRALQQAVQIGYIRTNPTDACKPPRVIKKDMNPLEDDQISAFLDTIQDHPHEYLYKITLFTGLREGEVLGLTWDCVDFEQSILTVKQQLRREQKRAGSIISLLLKMEKPAL